MMKYHKQRLFFISVIVTWMTMSSNSVFAQTTATLPTHYHELRFKTTFHSEYPDYPDADNTQSGTVLIYKDVDSSATKIRFSSSPNAVKQATLATSTFNPFNVLYPVLYTASNRDKLAKCPMLSVPFELDNDSATQEWFVSSSTYFCLGQNKRDPNKQGTDHDSHMWVLQKQANQQYRILMEGDNLMVVSRHAQQSYNQGYNDIESYLYLNRAQPIHANQCGGAINTWQWNDQQGRYQLNKMDYHARDCDHQHAQGEMMDRYHQRFIRAAKPEVDRIMQRR